MTAAALPLTLAPDRYKYKYLIAITVSLASVLELLDTSIVNVAIPHMMGNLGATLDQTVGGWITDMYGWPWIFYINIPFGMLALALTMSFITDSRHQERADRVDFLGLGLLAVGIGSLQTMLERGERLDWFSSGEVRLLGITSAIALISFIWHELRTEQPVVDLRILKSRQLAVGLYATVFVLPVYLQNVRNFTANQTGLVILPGALASAFTMAFMGRLQGKFDARLSIAAGVGIFALSMWKHAHFTTESGMSDFFWPLIFRGVGLGLIFVPLTNLALADLPMSKIPNGTGLFNLMRQLGGSVGIALSATLLQRFTAIHRADLAANVTPYAEATRERLAAITQTLIGRGELPALVEAKALRILDLQVTRQAMMLSFEQLFLLFAAVFVLSLPLLLLMHKSKGMPGGGGAA